jgi:hypothetical protein
VVEGSGDSECYSDCNRRTVQDLSVCRGGAVAQCSAVQEGQDASALFKRVQYGNKFDNPAVCGGGSVAGRVHCLLDVA